MKITILENNILSDSVVKNGIAKAVQLCQGIGFPLDVTYKTTSVVLTSIPLNTDVVQNGFGVNYQPILDSVDGSEDVACMIFDWSKVAPYDFSSAKPMNPCQFGVKKVNATPIQIPEQWYGGYDWVLTQFFLHELCHAIYFLVGQAQNDVTHNFSRSAYSQKQQTDYYLYLITTLIPAWNKYKTGQSTQKIPKPTQPIAQSVQKYQFFSQAEIDKWKMKPELFAVLDKMRKIANTPFIITSGLRTPQENAAIGGVPNSAHLRGLAADILCMDSVKRTMMLNGILTCGVPVFLEIAQKHLHISIDTSLGNIGKSIISNGD